jgi:hypothetical protein
MSLPISRTFYAHSIYDFVEAVTFIEVQMWFFLFVPSSGRRKQKGDWFHLKAVATLAQINGMH